METSSQVRRFLSQVRRSVREGGWSQTALARRAGLTQAFVSQLLSGDRSDISFASAVALASALSLPLEVGPRPRRRRPFSVKRAQAWLLDPPPGSKAAAARDYGVDLTLNARLLGETPDRRIAELQAEAAFIDELRRAPRVKRV